MNLEIFKHIDDVVEAFESKREIYKLIAEEIESYFEKNVFSQSKYTLNLVYRLKSAGSIREKLVRNSYISQYSSTEEILTNFQDLIGFRIECKFIDDEKYVYQLLRDIFTKTENGTYFADPLMPKIKLNLAAPQPQKQKNGFDIYKIDGIFMLGREDVRFELQIKALVNSFWGEVEHKIIYKNSAYRMVDGFVEDLMQSIKKSLNMIDSQLYVLYKRFKRGDGAESEASDTLSIERFISKMVYDTFYELMTDQIGFTIDFKGSCESAVRYVLSNEKAEDLEDYGSVMLKVLNILNKRVEEGVRVDTQLEFEEPLEFCDEFSRIMYDTVRRLVNMNYKCHLFFLVLFSLRGGTNCEALCSYLSYLRNIFAGALAESEIPVNYIAPVCEDVLKTVAQVFAERRSIEYLWEDGISGIIRSINYVTPLISDELVRASKWEDIRGGYMMMLRGKLLSV